MGQDEDTKPLVRRANFCRREEACRRRVTHAPKLSQHGLQAEGDVSGDVLEKNPLRAAFLDDAGDLGPEVAGIVGPTALSGGAEGLAGVSGEDRVEYSAKGAGIEAAQIVPDRGRGEISGALGRDEHSLGPVFPFDEGAGVIAGFGEHEAQIKAPPPAQRDNPCRGRDTMPFTALPARATVRA